VAHSGILETLARSAVSLVRSKRTRGASADAPAKTRAAASGLVRAT
jgi:hypothetical protein